ncbi:MAG: hypothetical protein AAGI01_10225, partial [Myxococcota bacterium]
MWTIRDDGGRGRARASVVWFWLCAVGSVCAPSPGVGEEAPGDGVEGEQVAVFVTEAAIGRGEPPASAQAAFWWAAPGALAYTQSDVLLQGALRARGIEVSRPARGVNISKIYRRPYLSKPNAGALGLILGSRRVFVGSVIYEELGGVPVGATGVKATVVVDFVDALAGAEQRIVLERVAWRSAPEDARGAVREDAMDSLGELMARLVERAKGEVGVESKERVLVVRGVPTERALEELRTALMALDGV